jgi:hypothetical protein
MALSQSDSRQTVEDAEMEFESCHYPEGIYPVRTAPPPWAISRVGDLQHYRLEKQDYSWSESSRIKLDTPMEQLESVKVNLRRLLRGFELMSRDRRAAIYRLLNFKNSIEEPGKIWYVAHMEIVKARRKKNEAGEPKVEVFSMEIIIERVKSSPLLFLQPMNGTFENKVIYAPRYPEVLRMGRQTNMKTAPTRWNGWFDTKCVSRQHAELWSDLSETVWIRDVKSSNGTFVNGIRLSPEGRESEPQPLRTGDILELAMDIVEPDDQKIILYHKISAYVVFAGLPGTSEAVDETSFPNQG